jgi:hypothetical protein
MMKPLEDQQKQEKQEVVFECEFNKEDPQVVWAKDNIDVKYALEQDRFSKKVIGLQSMRQNWKMLVLIAALLSKLKIVVI